ncbi:MAG: prepilin-type N-terminal cleavage/methylation domain-containing protein [Gammaproteobacteria bacterium]|nr:prepilin-type N-terminal cleavage/methylation domain-containing protein [Gammaproteobacteria bacterium]NND46293.1 prepilin-type N-terminal cleavage/methylation domain-containing protein [Woeseiaceae bacterium]
MNRRTQKGFTLVELVVVIVLSTIVVSFMAMFIGGPVRAYTDQARRSELVDLADGALRRIARDVRRALPNSVRVTTSGSVVALEMLNTVDGVRYREQPPPADPDKQLDFAAPDSAFNSVGTFTRVSKPFSSTSHYLSVYNVGVTGADAYELANVITPPGTQIDIDADATPGEDNVVISPAFQFAYGSPAQRIFLLDGPLTYLCDLAAGTLTRYSGYSISPVHAARDSAAELIGAGAADTLVSGKIAACNIAYAPGTSQRAGLVSLQLGISDAGEAISLLHQIHVNNVP